MWRKTRENLKSLPEDLLQKIKKISENEKTQEFWTP